MIGDQVEVVLQASKPQTVELLKQDRQLLDQMLRTTGYRIDSITIQAADDRPATHSQMTGGNTQNSGSATDGQWSAQGGAPSDQDTRGQNGHGQDSREDALQASTDDASEILDDTDQRKTGIPADGSLYL